MRELIAKDILYARLSSGRIVKRKIVRVTLRHAVTGSGFRMYRTPISSNYYKSLSGIIYKLENNLIRAEYEKQILVR